MKFVTPDAAALPYLRHLYKNSFPKEERKPFRFLVHVFHRGKMELLLLQENDENLGLTISAPYRDLVLIYYFAIDPKYRGKGLGSQAIALWRKRYPGKRIFLEIERPDEAAANQRQRLRRKHFYLKNGLEDTGLRVKLFGVPMEVLSLGGPVSYLEYHQVYRQLLGPFSHFVRPLENAK